MSARTPRHRAPPSEPTRRAERKVARSSIVIALMLGLLIWFAVATDNVLLVTVSAIGAVIGRRLSGGRKVSRRSQGRREMD